MSEQTSSKSNEERFARAKQGLVPSIYANGFAVGVTGADCSLVLERNGDPVAILNLSFTLAKTLALALGSTVSNFEQITGQQLLTTHDVDRLFTETASKDRENVNLQ